MKKKSTLAILTAFPLLVCQVLFAQNVGIGTTTPLSKLHISGGIFAEGTSGITPVNGVGTRLMWIPGKAAFRAGAILNTVNWDADSIGQYSFASGLDTRAKGFASVALGVGARATGPFAVALGNGALASGENSFATGTITNATGNYSTAMGYGSLASGERSTAIGSSTASGINAASFGNSTFASGVNAASFGNSTLAYGNNSTAMGDWIYARAYASFSVGSYNDITQFPNPTMPAPTDKIFEIGNGTSASRSNAVTVLRNGNLGIGTANPTSRVHLMEGSSGATGSPIPGILIESSGDTYLTFRTPEANRSAIFFGNNSLIASGAIVYNDAFFPQDANGLQFRTNGNNTRMVIYSNGNAWLQGTLAQNSDERLKKNIAPITGATGSINKLTGYHYYWKDGTASGEIQSGLIAQEVQKVFPELVSENGRGNLGINYSGMIPYLLEAIKEQQKNIEQLENDMKALRKKRK